MKRTATAPRARLLRGVLIAALAALFLLLVWPTLYRHSSEYTDLGGMGFTSRYRENRITGAVQVFSRGRWRAVRRE